MFKQILNVNMCEKLFKKIIHSRTMIREPFRVSLDSLKYGSLSIKGLELLIGSIAYEEVKELGPTPFPTITKLRNWDLLLLNRYKPFYMPICDMCCLCTYGKCDLTENKRGACGIDLRTQQARIVTLAAAIGAATHTSHARHLVEFLIHKYGRDVTIELPEVNITMPNTMLVTGIKPKTLGDLEKILNYVECEIVKSLSTVHTGQEGNYLDFESKALHLGMLDHVAMEIADVAQIVALNFPKGEVDLPFTEIGLGILDLTKPLVLCIGHNVSDGAEIVEYLEKSKLGRVGEILELAGLCCTAHDLTRHTHGESKIIGPISHQLRYIRLGIADSIVIDEQCINIKVVDEARKVNSPVIACTEKACYGLPDLTEREPDEIVNLLVTGVYPGALILDEEKVGEVAVKTALRMSLIRKKKRIIPTFEEIKEIASKCSKCNNCRRNCPLDLPVSDAIYSAGKGFPDLLMQIYDYCLGCGRCEDACPRGIPILSLITAASMRKVEQERFKIRIGRGPIRDVEIRNVGRSIVLGEIPGVIAFAGCATWPRSSREVAIMAREFARRGYIVLATGCSAMAIAMYRNEEGLTPYEEFPDVFDRGGLLNIGSCVANAHISGATIKIANIFAGRSIYANYEEIADYILNRVGACGIAWGAMSQKAVAIASGFNRLGIPVILGPHGAKYRRLYLGDREDRESFTAIDMRSGEKVYVGPAPEHLLYVAETMEECMVMAAKLCIRPGDTPHGRAIKLTHYIDLYKKFYGALPPDLHLFIRQESDIPITYKSEVLNYLRKVDWKPWEKVTTDVTISERVYRKYRR